MIRVMIVDDHKMVREGLTKLIEFDREIKVVEEADNGLDCMNKYHIVKPDIMLLDIDMPDMDGIETFKILSMHVRLREAKSCRPYEPLDLCVVLFLIDIIHQPLHPVVKRQPQCGWLSLLCLQPGDDFAKVHFAQFAPALIIDHSGHLHSNRCHAGTPWVFLPCRRLSSVPCRFHLDWRPVWS